MSPSRVALGLLAILALAAPGCVETPPANDGGPSASPPAEADPFGAPAAWETGRWWSYATQGGGAGPATTFVVTGQDDASYMMGTNSASTAAFHAEAPISFLGPIAKADLAGSQGGVPVTYFQFPLTPGASWSTAWDGDPHTVRAIGVQDGEFVLEAYRADILRVRYSYHPEAGFLGFATFFDADGEFTMRLAGHGANYTGQLVTATWQELVSARYENETASPAAQMFTMPADMDEAVFRLLWVCVHPGGSFDVLVGRPESFVDQEGFMDQGTCPGGDEYEEVLVSPPEGQWGAIVRWMPAVTPSLFELQVGVRTYETTPFPA